MMNPINSDQLVKSVQRDYRQTAEDHRMRQQFGQENGGINPAKAGLALTSLVGLLIALSQVVGG